MVLTSPPYHERVMVQCWFDVCMDPEGTEDTVSAIRCLLGYPEEAQRENGSRAVAEQYSWQDHKKKLLAFYCDILE